MTGADRRTRPRTLVTGIDGFTGVHLRAELEAHGHEVFGTGLVAGDRGSLVLDVTRPDDCARVVAEVAPDFVLHLAGISFVQSDPMRLYAVNVVGTTNLLEALAAAPTSPRKVILASSANIYGHREGDLVAESDEARPANHYATSKLAMERMAANYFDRLPIVMTRPFNYTGVGQSADFLIPKIVSHFARRADTMELGNLDVERDFSDVRMVVEVYRKLLDSPARGASLNICTGRATSLARIVELMEDISGHRVDVRTNPLFVRPNDVLRLTGDPRALIATIGPLAPPPLRDTLAAMYRAMQSPSPGGP